MSIIFILIPIAVLFVLIGLGVFFWAVRSRQFDDLDKEAYSILFDNQTKAATPPIKISPGSEPGFKGSEQTTTFGTEQKIAEPAVTDNVNQDNSVKHQDR